MAAQAARLSVSTHAIIGASGCSGSFFVICIGRLFSFLVSITSIVSNSFTNTFGFPLDLTELILRENGMTVNVEEFDAEMQQQKQRARNAAAIETGDWIILKEGTTEFVGYDYTEYETSILRYRQVKQKNQTLYHIM